jgi:hypothetical protein
VKGLARLAVLLLVAGLPTRLAAYSPLLPGSGAGRGFARQSSTPHPSVVRVIAPERSGMSLGSGTLVSVEGKIGVVLTNWHVVRDAVGSVNVVFPDGFRSPGSVLKTDRHWDLAAIAIARPRVAPVRLSSQAPRRGDLLTIAGYGPGRYRAVSGRCTQYYSPGRNLPFEIVELSIAARQGDSGGPIFNSEGELAGVLFGATSCTTSGTYCGRVESFLASIGVDPRASPQELLATIPSPSAPPAKPPRDGPQQSERLVPVAPPLAANGPSALPTPIGRSPGRTIRLPAVESEVPARVSPPLAAVNRSEQEMPVADLTASVEGRPPFLLDILALRDLAGTTPFEQTKTALALLAIAFVLAQGWRAFKRI